MGLNLGPLKTGLLDALKALDLGLHGGINLDIWAGLQPPGDFSALETLPQLQLGDTATLVRACFWAFGAPKDWRPSTFILLGHLGVGFCPRNIKPLIWN